MPRASRINTGEQIYHVINRANARLPIFTSDKEYQLFEQLLTEVQEVMGMRILAYTVMPNHWHLVLYPSQDGQLSQCMKWLTQTHTSRWHLRHDSVGSGHLYQGRYKSFPVHTDQYLLQLLRYVEANPVRAKLVSRAQDWRWGSAWRRMYGTEKQKQLLCSWPIDMPTDYLSWVNEPIYSEVLKNIRASIVHSKPFGNNASIQG